MVLKPLLELRGIITVLNTPLTDSDTVDVAALRSNVRRAIEAGVAGFLVPAMASEVYKLRPSERAMMVDAALEESSGSAVVIGGASAASRSERMAAAQQLVRQGCEAILVSIPFESEAAYRDEVHDLAELPAWLMLQDWDFSGAGIPVPLVAELFETVPAFRALKVEVVPAGAKYTAVLEATEGRLHVSGGWAVMQMIEALDRGVHAFMPTGMHRIYTTIYRRYVSGDRAGAEALFHRVLPVLAFANQHLDISIHFFKHLLHRQGVYPTARVREPILPFDRYHRATSDRLIDRAIAIEEELVSESR